MAEPVAVLSDELGLFRPDQVLPDERGERVVEPRLAATEGRDGASVEDLTLDRSALEHAALGWAELVEPRGQQRVDRGRDGNLGTVRLQGEGEHLLDEERISACGTADP